MKVVHEFIEHPSYSEMFIFCEKWMEFTNVWMNLLTSSNSAIMAIPFSCQLVYIVLDLE